MANITAFGPIAHLRSDAASYVLAFKQGQAVRSGRGLSFLFWPANTSVAELPVDDRQTTLFIHGRSSDFQKASVQGTVHWRVIDPDRLAQRVDFSLNLATGQWAREPLDRIDELLIGLATRAALQRLGELSIRQLLDESVEPLRAQIAKLFGAADLPGDYGITVTDVRIISLVPTAELEKALQTPTLQALQQKADEATYARRALAVDKERAIAENELGNRTELARREAELIQREAENARARATASAEERQLGAIAEAQALRVVEAARAEAEERRIAIYRDLPAHVQFGLAAREFAAQAGAIEHLTVTPELGQAIATAFRQAA